MRHDVDSPLRCNVAASSATRAERGGVLERYYKELIAFFTNSLRGDRETAADVVHESYARVLSMDANTAIPEPRALLYRVGKNIILDAARRNQVEAKAFDTLVSLHNDSVPSVEREVEARQDLARFMSRLSVMPRKRREAFILVKVYGYSHAEAASHLASTVASVEKHVVRGIMDLMQSRPGI